MSNTTTDWVTKSARQIVTEHERQRLLKNACALFKRFRTNATPADAEALIGALYSWSAHHEATAAFSTTPNSDKRKSPRVTEGVVKSGRRKAEELCPIGQLSCAQLRIKRRRFEARVGEVLTILSALRQNQERSAAL